MPTPTSEKRLVNDLVQEICSADPTLLERESELRAALTRLLAAKPAVDRNEAFLKELRARLMKEFSSSPKSQSVLDRLLQISRRPWFAVPAVALALLLVMIVMKETPPGKNSLKLAVRDGGAFAGVRVTRAESGFGSLINRTGDIGTLANGVTMDSGFQAPTVRNQSGGGGMTGGPSKMMASAVQAPMMGESSVPGVIGIMPIQRPTYYRYSFDGELALSDETLPVLRRVKGGNTVEFEAALAGVMPGVFDFSVLGSMKLQNFSAYQDQDLGLSVYADMNEETVSISQNYQRWPHPEQACRDQECYQSFRLTESDMPSDEESIAYADAFLAELGIDRTMLGAPEVRADWRRWLVATTTAMRPDFWFPDSVNVVYPLLVDGIPVVDDSGMGSGLTVNVNVRERRADGLWNLQSLNYESADYDAVVDVDAVKEVVERGGIWGYLPDPKEIGDADIITLRLGEPVRVMLRTWQYPGDGTSKELLAPGLRFRVEDPERDTHGTPEYITVPLIKEFFEQQPGYGGGPILYMKSGAGVAGSTTSSVGTVGETPLPIPAPSPEPMLR